MPADRRAMLKAGDVIISRHRSDNPSYWLMERDEVADDYLHSDKNASWIGGWCPLGFENDKPRRTSWDHSILDEQDAAVVSPDNWSDKICAMVAEWRLKQ